MPECAAAQRSVLPLFVRLGQRRDRGIAENALNDTTVNQDCVDLTAFTSFVDRHSPDRVLDIHISTEQVIFCPFHFHDGVGKVRLDAAFPLHILSAFLQ